MKKILSIMMVATTLIGGMTSCSKYLEEDNKTSSTPELTYVTASGLDGLIRSCYAPSRGWWGKEAGLGLTECGSDLFLGGYDNKQASLVSYNISARSLDGNTSDDACFDHYWELLYVGIDLCNNALYYTEQNTNIGEATKAQYRGEAYFLRALYYLQLVATWGPVPYITEPVKEQTYTPVRVPEAEMYKNILSDIELSIKNFKDAKYMTKADGGLQARANYYAAVALKARTALYAASWLGQGAVEGYTNLYQTASDAADEVITGSGASFYSRYSDTWNLNNEAVKDNKEAIWGVYYDNDLSTENCIPYRYKSTVDTKYPYNSLITRTGYTRGGSAMNLMFVSMWSNGVKQDGLGGNSTATDNVFIRTLGDASKNTFVKSAKTGENVDITKYYSPYGRGFTRYLPSLYLWRTLEGIRATDQRAEGTLLTHYNVPKDLEQNAAKYYPNMGQFLKDPSEAYEEDGNYFNAGDTAIYYSSLNGDSPEGKALQAWAKGRYRLQFATGGDIPVYDSDDMSKAVTTKAAKKTSDIYGDARYNNVNIGGWKSYPGIKKFLDDQYNPKYPTHDITYRDAIVFRLAEMYLIKAECQLATGGNALATLNELRAARAISGKDNSLKGTVDINTILEERAIELCGEQQRWFDLKRTHKLVEYVQARNGQAASNIKAIHYYRPIPEAELEACTNVITFPGTQGADGVIQYTTTADGMWQNPGY